MNASPQSRIIHIFSRDEWLGRCLRPACSPFGLSPVPRSQRFPFRPLSQGAHDV
jgi:hypothetical protein